jgi:T5orf172 domain
MPGFLYVAHNDEYRADLCKLGYTTVNPDKRIARLNQQVRLANDIGQFSLTHSTAVPTAYDAEQRIFEALQALRVAAKREFFVGPSDRFVNEPAPASLHISDRLLSTCLLGTCGEP